MSTLLTGLKTERVTYEKYIGYIGIFLENKKQNFKYNTNRG